MALRVNETVIRGEIVPAVYLLVFVWCFDVFSSTVINNKHGWIGSLILGTTQSVDIDNTYGYKGDDLFYCRLF